MINTVFIIIQMFFTMITGIYFFNMLKTQQSGKTSLSSDSSRELEKLHNMKNIRLTKPLAEKTRPQQIGDVIGQEDGIKALRAAICGPNPQHVIIYGPPGVGKTAASRIILKEAIASNDSPFIKGAEFVEIDATTIHFDERGIADPLIGSVHDPIYQGAGSYGPAGVPRPKPGAVTKAHGGVLFIDEIGEMHPTEMNKLLKVLEDRKVFLDSSYYSRGNKDIPAYVHEVFQKGLPADFRLIGATTKNPEDMPPALRSRCTEIFFNPLKDKHLKEIAKNAAEKASFDLEEDVLSELVKYSRSGRDAVNIVQTAGSLAYTERRHKITSDDIKWVARSGRYSAKYEKHVFDKKYIGLINGLAVIGGGEGAVIDIEATAERGEGSLRVTGIIEKQEMNTGGQKLIRNSSARASIENMLTVLNRLYNINTSEYNIHINFPGGMPIDGPSAGCAVLAAVYSAITKKEVSNLIAMTGEISIHGKVMPVGGVVTKIEAACAAGAKLVFVPKENYDENIKCDGITVMPVSHINEIFEYLFDADVSGTIEESAAAESAV